MDMDFTVRGGKDDNKIGALALRGQEIVYIETDIKNIVNLKGEKHG